MRRRWQLQKLSSQKFDDAYKFLLCTVIRLIIKQKFQFHLKHQFFRIFREPHVGKADMQEIMWFSFHTNKSKWPKNQLFFCRPAFLAPVLRKMAFTSYQHRKKLVLVFVLGYKVNSAKNLETPLQIKEGLIICDEVGLGSGCIWWGRCIFYLEFGAIWMFTLLIE